MDISEFTNQLNNINCCAENKDGRVNSIKDEEILIDEIKKLGKILNVSVVIPKSRHWCDVIIAGIPVQIKSTTGKAADNWSSRKALIWALGDDSMEDVTSFSNKHRDVQEKLLTFKNLDRDFPRDMDTLCVDKGTGKVHHKTLCTLQNLVPNGNNLPFQIKWKKEWSRATPKRRSQSEAFKFLISAYTTSVKKKQEQDNLQALKDCLE